MKKPGNIVRHLLIVTLALSACSSVAFGQTSSNRWSSNGPYGGAIRWFAIAPGNPNLVYARGNDMFKSVDGGVTWTIANSEIPGGDIRAMAFDPLSANTIYASSWAGGSVKEIIFKSTNAGGSWTEIYNGFPKYTGLTSLIVDPQNPANLYAVTPSRIFRSTDGGANWNAFGPCLDCSDVSLAIDPNNTSILFASFNIQPRHLSKSTDGGATWNEGSIGVDMYDWGPLHMAVARNNSNLIYAATSHYGDIFRSVDGGAHWGLVYMGRSSEYYYGSSDGGIDAFVVDPINPNVAYAGTRGRGVLKTTDGGATWSQFNTGLNNTVVYGLTIDPANGNNIFAATDGSGAFRSTNAGASWNELTIGRRRIAVRALATTGDPNVVYAGAMSVFKSTNAGASWNTYAAATTSSVVNSLVVDPDNKDVVYALMDDFVHAQYAYDNVGGSVFKSTDGGVTWSAAQNGLANLYVTKLLLDPRDHNTIYAGSWNGIFKSSDAGGSWDIVRGSVCCIINLAISPANNRTIYASAYNGDYVSTVFKNTDGSANWDNIGGTLPDYVGPLAVDPNNADVIYAIAGSIYKSTDGGDNWTEILKPSGGSYFSGLVVDPTNSNTLYANGDLDLLKRSTDGGASWSSFSDGLNGAYIARLAIDPSGRYLHAGTDAGVFSIEISPSIPPPNHIDDTQFFVHQHYLDFLNREPDLSGLAFWTNEINSCGADPRCIEVKRINVSAAYFLSIEFQQTGYLVYRTYKASYGNLPDAPVPIRFTEFLPDTQQIGRGVVVNQTGWETVLENNKQAFMSEFVQRTRFTVAYPSSMTPAQFVDALFANAGVTPASTDRSAAITEFGSATNTSEVAARARALRRVAENATLVTNEFNRAFVLMQYFGYLRRNPNDVPESNFDGYNFWLNKLNQFNGNFVSAEMVKAFITSTEYRRRFGP